MQISLKKTGFLVSLFTVSFVYRFLALSQTPYANGWDGYFYINQVRSFVEEGKMDVPDSSLIYPLLMLVQVVTNNYILSLKILSCVLAGSFSMSVFLLSLKWSDNIRAAMVLACFTLFSPHLTYFAAQYPKNLFGVILFLWLLYFADSKIKFLPLLLLVLNFFGHRITAVLSFLSLLAHYIFVRLPRYSMVIVIVFSFLFLIAGFLIPGILNLFDLERFRGIFTASYPHFAPYSFVKTFGTELISVYWLAEIVSICIVFVVAIVFAGAQITRKKSDHRMTTLLIILLLLIFPFFEWSLEGAAFRLLFVFILVCPLLTLFLIKDLRNSYVTGVLCVGFFLSGLVSYKSYRPAKHDPPYGVYNVAARQIASTVDNSTCELIIAHKSLAEYMVYATGIDAMSWIPEYEIETEKLWRIAADVKDIQFSFYLEAKDLDLIYRLTPSYCFIREDVWRKFIGNVEKDHNTTLLEELRGWRNPDKLRPYFMLKNRK